MAVRSIARSVWSCVRSLAVLAIVHVSWPAIASVTVTLMNESGESVMPSSHVIVHTGAPCLAVVPARPLGCTDTQSQHGGEQK